MHGNSKGEEIQFIKDRTCKGCTLCCKVMSIEELGKPQGQWCKHCDPKQGCANYEKRPNECKDFFCGYLTWPILEDHWRPVKCKLVVVSDPEATGVAVHVDPNSPSAWRQEPFFSELKWWSKMAAKEMYQVVVCIGKRTIVILPDREVDLGVISDDERIIMAEVQTPSGIRLDALKMRADDPHIAGLSLGKPVRLPKNNR